MKSLLKTPLFWLLFVGVSGIAGTIAFYYFPQANPIIHLNLTMNRSQAIDKAQTIATQFSLGPTEVLHAAQFYTDELVKTFVELEGGGKDTLIAMIEHNLYQPYHWIVRRFKPFEHHEVLIYFTSDGNPYGFKETISENTSGINITSAAAQTHIEQFVQAEPWHIPLAEYKLIETSQEIRPSGRLDHIFTYERTNEKVGEGFYRLKIVVSGNHISELSHLVKVPDAFKQRYENMRSANENIAYAATIIMLVLYVIGCCFIGLFILMQQRFVIWHTPLYWGMFIAALVALNIPNQLPLHWMDYNTAHSPYAFLIQQGISVLATFLLLTIAFSIIFMAAESLSRRAFGHHIQLWHIYNPQVASTLTILGYTIAGYLLVPIMLCYTVLFYVVVLQWFGWWVPSSSLYNPNILASYFPWLESISVSLQAGFFEECLFRAVPLACGALLGNRFGKRSWWIAGAFILQAIVFGAAHANYPAQPAYARLVELLADSTLFGTVYLLLGLLPAIITHFIYDVFWFALPIFVSTAPGAFFNKIIIICLALIPLCIVLIARIKTGAWHTIAPSLFNRAWQPAAEKQIMQQQLPPKQSITLQKHILYSIYVLGSIGLILWCMYTQFYSDAPSFTISRTAATEISKQLAHEKNIDTTAWYFNLSPFIHYTTNHDVQKQHRFVWQKGGKEAYHQLINTYLTPPLWTGQFVKFEGPLIDRAEEHEFGFRPDGSFFRSIHLLPETRPGSSLSQADAQKLARTAIAQQFHLTSTQLHEVSAVADKQPERLDWLMTYSSSDYPLTEGEGRIAIKIAGDEIVDSARYVHVPEQWARAEENRILMTTIINQLCMLATWLIVMLGASIALLQWHIYSARFSLIIFAILTTIFLGELCNSWPVVITHFTTSQPFYDQVFRSFILKAIFLILRAAAMAIACSFVTYIPMIYHMSSFVHSMLCGISLGAFISGIQAALLYMVPSPQPTWPNYAPLQFLIPFTAGITSTILNYLALTLLFFLCVICMNKVTHYGKKRALLGMILSSIFGYIGAGLLFASHITLFGIAGLVFALFFYASHLALLRFDYPIIPMITATYVIFETVQQFFFHGYPLAQLINILSSCIIAIIAWTWSKKLYNA